MYSIIVRFLIVLKSGNVTMGMYYILKLKLSQKLDWKYHKKECPQMKKKKLARNYGMLYVLHVFIQYGFMIQNNVRRETNKISKVFSLTKLKENIVPVNLYMKLNTHHQRS